MSNDQWDSPLVALLCDEVVKDQPGQAAVLDRLLDLLLIAVLRAWFARPEAEVGIWFERAAPGHGPLDDSSSLIDAA